MVATGTLTSLFQEHVRVERLRIKRIIPHIPQSVKKVCVVCSQWRSRFLFSLRKKLPICYGAIDWSSGLEKVGSSVAEAGLGRGVLRIRVQSRVRRAGQRRAAHRYRAALWHK